MAHSLHSSPTSPVLTSIGQECLGNACNSESSAGTVRHNRLRSISTSSLSSVGSYFIPSLRQRPDVSTNTPPRSVSSINVNFGKMRSGIDRRSSSIVNSRCSSFAGKSRELKLVDVAESDDELARRSEDSEMNGHVDFVRHEEDQDSTLQIAIQTPLEIEGDARGSIQHSNVPVFRRWASKLRKKRYHAPAVSARVERWTLDDFDRPSLSSRKPRRTAHHKSDSNTSSLGFVTAIKSATATLASVSIATVSKRTTKWRRGQQRSSILSDKDPRPSVDSTRSIMDEAAKQRSRKRREKIEELIRTEESYVADIKALSNAYFNILGHQPTATSFARHSAQKTISEILHLHDDLLGRLHQVVPFAEYDQITAKVQDTARVRSHIRWHSVDVVPQRLTPTRAVLSTIRQGRRSLNISRSSGEDPALLRCSPQSVRAVTQAFADYLARFQAYEEYGANYDLVQRDIDETQRATAMWAEFDKAIEAISVHVNPVKSKESNRKKALTVKDLLIKPIQRIPRYELLFNDLCRLTPVYDDPDAHAAVEELCSQLCKVCQRVNEAKENPSRVRLLEATCLVTSRLTFSGQVTRSAYIRLLGQVHLCGCLYIAYRSKERIKGSYVISVLFESHLLLCTAEEDSPRYSVLAAVALAHATIEETDNLKGLQCHTAPHSWKLVFEHAARMYELIVVACSATEADVWRSYLASAIEAHTQAIADGGTPAPLELSSPLTSDMKSIGKAFGKPGSFVRRMSIHRTATVGPTTDLNQVIIKNTQAVKEVQDGVAQATLQIPRSQSVQTPSHVQTLAPRRAERHRLETVLTDVWTKELLPYPGMVRRSDPIRASANHVIRKFSMASITSNFSSSKRTGSHTSVASSRKEELAPPRTTKGSRRSSRSSSRLPRPPPVNFHTAPDAFLPADFDLQDRSNKQKRSALRTFTMTMERPFSPLLDVDNKPSGLRRAQSVRDVGEATPAPPQSRAPVPVDRGKKTVPQVYSVVQERAKTPINLQVPDETTMKGEHPSKRTPRKSKSKMLLRLFG